MSGGGENATPGQFSNPLFNAAPMQNAPVPVVQQPSTIAPVRPQLPWLEQMASLRAGKGGK